MRHLVNACSRGNVPHRCPVSGSGRCHRSGAALRVDLGNRFRCIAFDLGCTRLQHGTNERGRNTVRILQASGQWQVASGGSVRHTSLTLFEVCLRMCA